MKNKLTVLIVLILSFLAIDQLIKFGIKINFVEGQSQPLLGNWFVLNYIENPGMAFGTTFGSSIWSKLGLSIFRIFAIIGIGYYLLIEYRKDSKLDFLVAISLIFIGALAIFLTQCFMTSFSLLIHATITITWKVQVILRAVCKP